MAKRESYESRVEAYLLPLMERHGFELVDVEYVKEAGTWYLRAYIDKEDGIGVDDCEVISRDLSDWLDEEDFIDDSYVLEVSSPGLDRPLKKEKDYIRSMGRDVDVRLYRAVDKQKEFTGALTAYDDTTVTLTMEDGSQRVFDKKDQISSIEHAIHETAAACADMSRVRVGAGAGPTLRLTAAWLCSNLLREADFEGKRKPLRRRKRRRGEAA